MTALLGALFSLYLLYLLWEAHAVRIARKKLAHVVHVNGTRGKSTVSRLIEAGLREGGMRVFCKTTGTDPMTIDVNGREEPIRRRGKANIKEQIAILRRAAAQDAQVLVVECMAITPEFQQASQRDILRADIGVITNVRRDHTDVMGDTLPQIAEALCHTVPQGGVLLTAETVMAERLKTAALSAPKSGATRGRSTFQRTSPLRLLFVRNSVCRARQRLPGCSAFRATPTRFRCTDWERPHSLAGFLSTISSRSAWCGRSCAWSMDGRKND